ncbi:DUF4214 domain-containing protein [Siccirubricoccus phaeus]|uniref:DUF4214 domain-containing protein n=1 Tax=Siccirubricoccus phaeus TaxID=2595053 RepID=UPI0011F0C922|nr:DUF4214 domain-containing protein [Siccirubricoccus phaeus]
MPRAVTVNGVLPSLITENTLADAWVGNLALSGDIGGLSRIEVTGRYGLFFSAEWNAATRLISISPSAALDFEAFNGASTLLDLQLRLVFADNTTQDLAQRYQVTVLDQDDTAPTALAFATGGAVTAGAIGATIGTLAVADPDTSTGRFYFSFSEEDAWRFEVVGNTLKLRDGISLGLDDGPVRTVFIQVSDGLNSAAFALDITVRTDESHSVIPVLRAGESLAGFTLDAAGTVLRGGFEARDVTTDNAYGDTVRQLQNDAGEVWVSGLSQVKLADGQVDYAADSVAAKAAALQAALLGQVEEGAALGAVAGAAEAGMAWVDLAASLAGARLAATSDADFVTGLFQTLLGRVPSAAELALQTGRLASGLDRDQFTVDLALSQEGLAHQAAQDTDGLWSFTATGAGSWRSDAGALGRAASAPGGVTDGVWVM